MIAAGPLHVIILAILSESHKMLARMNGDLTLHSYRVRCKDWPSDSESSSILIEFVCDYVQSPREIPSHKPAVNSGQSGTQLLPTTLRVLTLSLFPRLARTIYYGLSQKI